MQKEERGKVKQKRIWYVFGIVALLMFAGCGKENLSKSTEENGFISNDTTTQAASKVTEPVLPVPEVILDENEPEQMEYSYSFYELWCMADTGQVYEVTEDGACRVVFEEQYNQLTFALPEGINMAMCDYVTVKAKSEYAELAVKLFDKEVYADPWTQEVYTRYDCHGEGVQEYELYPALSCVVWGIGLMSSNDAEDFSQYSVEAYSVTFHMKSYEERNAIVSLTTESNSPTPTPKITKIPTETEDPTVRPASVGENGTVRRRKTIIRKQAEPVRYTAKQMEQEEWLNISCQYDKDESMRLNYDRIYGRMVFELKDVIDMKYCEEIIIRFKNEVGKIDIDLHNEDNLSVEVVSYEPKEGIREVRLSPKYEGYLEYIRFMANDGELEDYSGFETTIYSVEFLMTKP